MKLKHYLSIGLLASTAFTANAQFNGNKVFIVDQVNYADLNTPTIITSPGWDDFDEPGTQIPLGFNFNIFGETYTNIKFGEFSFGGDFVFGNVTSGLFNAFSVAHDVMESDSMPNSDISYYVDSTAADKILKLQWRNNGLWGDTVGSDYINYQMWLHEHNSDIEFYFGPSQINTPTMELTGGEVDGFFWGFLKGFDPNAGSFDSVGIIQGNPLTVEYTDMNGFMSAMMGGATFPQWPVANTRWRIITPNTGVNGVNLTDAVSVYPTKVENVLNVTVKDAAFQGTLYLYDVMGKLVKTQVLSSNKNEIEVSDLAAGNYMINIVTPTQKIYYKIVK